MHVLRLESYYTDNIKLADQKCLEDISMDELQIMCDDVLFGHSICNIQNIVTFLETVNAEAVDGNWLTGWMIAAIICDEMSDDIILLNCIYDNVDAGNILSGFNHYVYSSVDLDIEWNWLCIDPPLIKDPYSIRRIYPDNFITCDNVQLLTKQIHKKTSYNNIFVSTTGTWKSIMVGLNVLNKFGIGFIRLNKCNINTLNIIAYISSVSSCEIICMPWGHVYLKFNNFNDHQHEVSSKSLYFNRIDNTQLYPAKILHRILTEIKSDNTNRQQISTDIDWFDKLKKFIHSLEDSGSIFYQES